MAYDSIARRREDGPYLPFCKEPIGPRLGGKRTAGQISDDSMVRLGNRLPVLTTRLPGAVECKEAQSRKGFSDTDDRGIA